MELLERIVVSSGDRRPEIQLYWGDLTRLTPEESVDILVVSAFPDDYFPTPTSLIGALDRAGVSVSAHARDKAEDLRAVYGCWLSKPVGGDHGFDRMLVFEPSRRGTPPEVVGDIFRCLMPVIDGGAEISSVAMPLVASGDQRWPAETMFEPLLEAAVRWLEIGLSLDVIKIVERSRDKAEVLRARMKQFSKADVVSPGSTPTSAIPQPPAYDVFFSYAREDQTAADFLASELQAHPSKPRLFLDRLVIDPGSSWQQPLWEALDVCRKVVAMYSEPYLASKVCQEEYGIARIRERREGHVLVPLYVTKVEPILPAHIALIDYIDCRDADRDKMRAAIPKILA